MPTLGEHFLGDCTHMVSKRLFGGYQMRLGSMFFAGLWVFQKGALLGRARRSSFQTLGSLVAKPGSNVAQAMKQSAEERMSRLSSREVADFWEFWCLTECPNVAFEDLKVLKFLLRRKVRLYKVISKAAIWAAEGIGFGATFPDFIESLWCRTYDAPDPEKWTLARQAGLDLPEHQTPLPLEEVEAQVLAEVRVFAQQNRPDLVGPLAL
ncbi:MAG: hypothetical protein WBC53_03640 [Phycisphaerae bacterium]